MRALVDQDFLKLRFDIFDDEFTLVGRYHLVFLAVNENQRDLQFYLLVECNSKRVVLFSYGLPQNLRE